MPLGYRIVPILFILVPASVPHAQGLISFRPERKTHYTTAVRDLNRAIANSDTVVTTGASSKVTLGLRLLSKVDEGLIRQFNHAWSVAKAGFDTTEGVVVIYLMRDGRYKGRSPGTTNEFEQASFKWDPATIAIVHTHPNSINARPSLVDQELAERVEIPVFTITNRGMYVYNPTTRETTQVMAALDWLDLSKWVERAKRHPTPVDEYSDLSY